MKNINCNICGSSDHELILRNWDRLHRIDHRQYNLVRCRGCGLIFLNPQPEEIELRRYYPPDYGPHQKNSQSFKYGFFSKFFSKVYKLFKSGERPAKANTVSGAGETVKVYLDFGCGSGQALVRVRDQHKNWDLYGFDNNETACARARELGFKIYCGDILKAELPDNFFDIINMSHVIEHLPDPTAALTKISRLLKDGGTIIISTPNYDSMAAKIFGRFWYALDTPRHLFIFSSATLSALLEKTGFMVEGIKYKNDFQVALKSWYFIFNRTDMRINPIIWRLARLLSWAIFPFYRQASIMTIVAKKKSVA